jgi:polar amino acid transport system substrate-binding protein
MSVKIWGIIILIYSGCIYANNPTRPIKICLDNASWRPFIYQENGQVKGLHIDTINQSLKKSNILFEYIPAPWKRCLKGAEKGVFDAIATASYDKQRSEYLWYPKDASEKSSLWRVGQVQYNIIVHQSSEFDYNQDLNEIPQPTRVPRDFSIGNDLKKLGFVIDDSSITDLQNLKRLVREKTGSIIALPALADWAEQQEEFKGEIRLIQKPIKSKSYFLVFSKNGQIDLKTAEQIWQQIKIIREQNQFKEYLPSTN